MSGAFTFATLALVMRERGIGSRVVRAAAFPLLLTVGLMVGCSGSDESDSATSSQPPASGSPPPDVVVLHIQDRGDIRIELYPEHAPNHVENFLKLAGEGYYAGTRFHRVIPEFMILGGDHLSKDDDPANDGTGSPGYALDPEPNELRHERGIVGMGRRADGKSDGSQFYIMLADNSTWKRVMDGRYTAFGRVIEGMDVALAVAAVERDLQDAPLEPQIIERVSLSFATE